MKTPQRILVPTDFSESADKAVEEAVLMALQFNAQLYLLHVVSDIQQCAVDYCIPEEMVIKYRNESVQGAKKKIQDEISRHPEAKNLKLAADVRIGTPYEEILREAETNKIDLIIIASHGKTGLLHHPIGSIAERVSRGAKCPVMLIKS